MEEVLQLPAHNIKTERIHTYKEYMIENLCDIISRFGTGAKIGCIMGIVVMSPFAVYFGIIIGGNFGGSLGWQLAQSVGVLIGIILGFIIIAGLILIIGGLLGGCIGYGIEYLIRIIS